MKIRCDVCEKAEASVFCSADEAALCEPCDRQVHHANKLATKHTRFSLLHPSSSKQSPLCDICQERRAFLFCKEDRAILCRECDIAIHRANEITKRHNRYLLTGVKLSASCRSSNYQPSSSSSSCSDANKNIDNYNISENLSSNTTTLTSPSSIPYSTNNIDNNGVDNNVNLMSTSNMSEYLDTIPGWRVDDFLDPSEAYWKGVNVENYEHPFSWGI